MQSMEQELAAHNERLAKQAAAREAKWAEELVEEKRLRDLARERDDYRATWLAVNDVPAGADRVTFKEWKAAEMAAFNVGDRPKADFWEMAERAWAIRDAQKR